MSAFTVWRDEQVAQLVGNVNDVAADAAANALDITNPRTQKVFAGAFVFAIVTGVIASLIYDKFIK